MIACRAYVPLSFFGNTTPVVIAKRSVVKYPDGLISKTHFEQECLAAIEEFLVFDKIRFPTSELKFVSVWLFWIDNVGTRSLYNVVADGVALYDGFNRVIVEHPFSERAHSVNWPHSESGRSSRIAILNPKFKRLMQFWGFFKASTHWGNPRPRIGDQGFSRQFVRFDHLNELTPVNEGHDYSQEDSSGFEHRLPQWRLIGPAIASFFLALWGWGCIRNERRIAWGFLAFIGGCVLWAYLVNLWLGELLHSSPLSFLLLIPFLSHE